MYVQLLYDSDGEASIAPAGGGYLIFIFVCLKNPSAVGQPAVYGRVSRSCISSRARVMRSVCRFLDRRTRTPAATSFLSHHHRLWLGPLRITPSQVGQQRRGNAETACDIENPVFPPPRQWGSHSIDSSHLCWCGRFDIINFSFVDYSLLASITPYTDGFRHLQAHVATTAFDSDDGEDAPKCHPNTRQVCNFLSYNRSHRNQVYTLFSGSPERYCELDHHPDRN